MYKKLVLIILDGWGCGRKNKFNAIKNANTPNWDKFLQHAAIKTKLFASGKYIGLPEKQVGNSEIGHMTLGAGRFIKNDLTIINNAIKNGLFYSSKLLNDIFLYLKKSQKTLHFIGLLSSGGIHSHENHMLYLIKLAHSKGINNIFIHAFLDGRDSSICGAIDSIKKIQNLLDKLKVGNIINIIGRFYAMDRNNNWDRTKKAYQLIIEGKSDLMDINPVNAILNSYSKKIYDEFINPTNFFQKKLLLNKHVNNIKNNDVILLMNFRSDRITQFINSIIDKDFTYFNRETVLDNIKILSLTKIHNKIPFILNPEVITNTLGQIIQDNKLTQLRIAEKEKFHHITSFFNCSNIKFKKEDHIIINSNKVINYDINPEMSAITITTKLIKSINKNFYNLIVCNYANADMLGHTGNYFATLKGIEILDVCLGQVFKAIEKNNYHLFITADHGNAEIMFDEEANTKHTRHTMNLVPFIYVNLDKNIKIQVRKNDIITIANVAPTILEIMKINKPLNMTGKSLFKILKN